MTRGLRTCLSRLMFLGICHVVIDRCVTGIIGLAFSDHIPFFFSSFLGWESVSKFPLYFSRPLGKYLVTMAIFQDPTAPPSFIALSPLISYSSPPPPHHLYTYCSYAVLLYKADGSLHERRCCFICLCVSYLCKKFPETCDTNIIS